MTRRSTAGNRFPKRLALALAAGALMTAGSPAIAVSSAAEGNGPHREVQAGFGDCKNHNSGLHNGYDCPVAEIGVTS
jgi:hypothetical protein